MAGDIRIPAENTINGVVRYFQGNISSENKTEKERK